MGRPKGSLNDKPWAEALRKAAFGRIKNGQRALERIAHMTVAAAEQGDMTAVREIGDRLDGKPRQQIDSTVQVTRLVARMPEPAKNTDEWLERHARQLLRSIDA